jgi:hypothetical protein
MESDRTLLVNTDEAWIAKYRAALKAPPIQQPGLMRVRVALNNAHNIFISHIDKIFDHWTQARWQKPAPPSELVLIPEPQPSTLKVNSGRQPSKKAPLTTGRSRLAALANKYRAG